jgi:hypothetical protein
MLRTSLTALAAWIALAAAPAALLAGDIHVPDANPAKGSTIGIPWGLAEVRYQALVTSARMGGQKLKITDLAFAPATSGVFQASQLEIRMAHHTAQNLSVTYDNNLSLNRTTVYSGPIVWTFQAGQWIDIGLNAPFAYNGTDNLVVEVRFVNGQNGPSCYAGTIPTFFSSGTGAYHATQTGNVLLRAAPKMRFHYNRTEVIGSGSTAPGGVVDFTLRSPDDVGLTYQVGTSLGVGPIPIDTRSLSLSPDALLVASVGGTLPMVFEAYAGRLDTTGNGLARLHLPNLAALKGVRLHTAFLTLSSTAPSGVANIADTFTFTIQ